MDALLKMPEDCFWGWIPSSGSKIDSNVGWPPDRIEG